MFANNDLDHEIIENLEPLKNVPPRDPAGAINGRTKYLATARSHRHSLNRQSAPRPLRNKRSPSLVFKVATIALALVLLVAGVGAGTVYAAQSSLPNQPLYGLKTYSENLRLDLAGDSSSQFQLMMQFISNRGDEITGLKAAGEPVEEPVMTMLQQQMFYSLQLAAGMEDGEMQAALNQFRNALMQQEQKMQQAQQGGENDSQLQQVQAMLQQHKAIAEGGLQDPVLFRSQARSGNLYGQPEMPGPAGPPEELPAKGEDPGFGPGPQGEPNGNGDPAGPSQQGPAGPSENKNDSSSEPAGPGGPADNGSPADNGGFAGGGSSFSVGELTIMSSPVITPTVVIDNSTGSGNASGNQNAQKQGPAATSRR